MVFRRLTPILLGPPGSHLAVLEVRWGQGWGVDKKCQGLNLGISDLRVFFLDDSDRVLIWFALRAILSVLQVFFSSGSVIIAHSQQCLYFGIWYIKH